MFIFIFTIPNIFIVVYVYSEVFFTIHKRFSHKFEVFNCSLLLSGKMQKSTRIQTKKTMLFFARIGNTLDMSTFCDCVNTTLLKTNRKTLFNTCESIWQKSTVQINCQIVLELSELHNFITIIFCRILTAITISKGNLWTLTGDLNSCTMFTKSQKTIYKIKRIRQSSWLVSLTRRACYCSQNTRTYPLSYSFH